MGNLFAELKRRHIYRVAAAYAVVAWVLIQLFNNLTPILKLPDWAGTLILVLLIGGFPITLIFAWIHQFAGTDGATPRLATTKLDYVLAGSLIVVIALVSYEQLARTPGAKAVPDPSPSQSGSISIAVLPLANLSGDAGQEFFSDGMTDEIITALTKVSALRIVGRESAYQYKGQKTDMRTVGQALGANYLIAGSVRKDGDRVRISAQLTRADTGVNLWADSYDRELKDIFATQSDIAQAIQGALRVPLGLQQGETLVSNRTGDLDSYQQYLRGKAFYRARSIADAVSVLEPVVARDPGFAPGWALLALAYTYVPTYGGAAYTVGTVEAARLAVLDSQAKAEMAARRAIQLDPKIAGGYAALAGVQQRRGRWAEAEDFYKQALALDSSDADTLNLYSLMLSITGRLKEALPIRERLRTLEPFVPIYNIITATVMDLAGQQAAAIRMLEAVPRGPGTDFGRDSTLAERYAAAGRYTEAADVLLATQATERVSRRSIEDAARLLRQAPAKADAPEKLPVLDGPLNFAYVYVGAFDRVMENNERFLEINYYTATSSVWIAAAAPLRKTERFKKFVRDVGWVDYWRARGWPDLCRPVGADDFVCD